jgi:hypothetical protein
LILINAVALIFSQHRNLIGLFLLANLIGFLLRGKQKLTAIITISVSSFVLLLIISNVLEDRLTDSMQEATAALHADYSVEGQNAFVISQSNTTEFRIFHFLERFRFVLQEATTSLLGIGFVTEDDDIARTLPFNIGLTDDAGNVIQVSTGDIYWSILILHTGISGVIIYLLMFLRAIVFYAARAADTVAMIIFLYLLQLFCSSFYGMELIMAHIFAMLYLLIGLYHRAIIPATLT